MDSQWQELIDWFDGLPAERRQFFEEVRQQILAVDPDAYRAMLVRIQNQVLQSLICGDTEFVMVARFVPADWAGTPWEAINDVTRDMANARWWQLAFVIDTAIRHRERLNVGGS